MANPQPPKYRVGLTLSQYELLARLVLAEKNSRPHTIDYECELIDTYKLLTRAISNIRGGIKQTDSNYIPEDRRQRARRDSDEYSAESLGLTDTQKLEEMSEAERDAFFAEEEARLLAELTPNK